METTFFWITADYSAKESADAETRSKMTKSMAKLKKVLEVMATSKISPRLGRNGRFTQGYRRAYRVVVCLDDSLSSDERQPRKLFVEPKGTPWS